MSVEKKLLQLTSRKNVEKLRKILIKVYFFAIATSFQDIPQATMVQPILNENWKLIFISKSNTKKVRNLERNPHTWMIADATGIFKIPKVVYIKGSAFVEPLSQKDFDEFISYHGPISKRLMQSLVKDGLEGTSRIVISPEKFITVGIFGDMTEQISFDLD